MHAHIGDGPGNVEFEVVRGPKPIPLDQRTYVRNETDPDYVRWVYLVPGAKLIQPFHVAYHFPQDRYFRRQLATAPRVRGQLPGRSLLIKRSFLHGRRMSNSVGALVLSPAHFTTS